MTMIMAVRTPSSSHTSTSLSSAKGDQLEIKRYFTRRCWMDHDVAHKIDLGVHVPVYVPRVI